MKLRSPKNVGSVLDSLRLGLGAAWPKKLITSILCCALLSGALSAQTLQHRYSFVSDASDSVGGANGTVVAPNGGTAATIANGLTLPGGGGGGFSGYVTFPSGILTTTTNLTIECWVTQDNGNDWATIWDFGSDGNHNFELCPQPASGRNGGNMIVAFTPNSGENDLNTGLHFPNGEETYVALTYDASSLIANLYTNGAQVGTLKVPDATYTPGTIGGAAGTSLNALGRDVYNDGQFQGTVYEFRIWNGAVSQRYIAASALVGPGTVVNNLTPTSAALTAGTGLVVSGTEQASVTVRLAATGTADLPATADATNWVSSNPNVLKVNSSGTIVGVSVGTATVSATVGGVVATSGPISVTAPQTLIHRYSFVSDATDSVGGADGTIVAPTTGDPATIANGLTLPGNTSGGFGYSGYVSFPSGILTNTTSVTIECWATQNQGNTWAELWDFGNNGNQNFAYIPYPANNGNNPEVPFTPNGNERDLQAGTPFPNGTEQYVAVTYNNYSLVGNLYTNGQLEATTTFPNTSYCPGTIGGAGGTTQNMLGNDVYGDWQFSGTVYEFRIWNGAVTPAYVAAASVAGPGIVITNLVPQALSISLASTSMIGAGTQQATVTGNFIQVANVVLTSAATNWVSSNPNVISVSSSGLITALNGGTATISATVNGVTATSSTITVASTPPTFVQKPAATSVALGSSVTLTASALGGGLGYQWSFNGSPIAGATNTTFTLSNVTFGNSGNYSVAVANNLGSTNATAVVTVKDAVLLHRYSFISDASDSVGTANGTLVNPNGGSAASIGNGLNLPGGGGGGYSGYLSLPSGILTNTTSLTVEVWATQANPNTWATIWDFGTDGNHNFELCPAPASGRNNGNMIVAFTPHGNESDLNTPTSFPSGTEQYVSVTYNNASLTGSLYTNGALDATLSLPDSTYRPSTIGGATGTSANALGNDVYGDPQFQGTVYEFRIWDGAVSPLYVAISSIAGPSVLVTNLTPTTLTVTAPNASMVVSDTQQASVVGDFVDASGVPVTGAVTNWTSSNTNVLRVSSTGLITATGVGSATISATVNGLTGVSSSITVPNSAPIITQQPAAAETLLVGARFTTSVTAVGSAPFTYYWLADTSATPISVSTSPTLTLANVSVANTANYTCIVSNQYGTATSSALALTVVAPTAYEQSLLNYHPLAYWPLNETSGNTAYDVIGGNNGTYQGNYSLGQPGPANTFFGGTSYAASFDGSSAYVDVPVGPFNITNAITVVAWVQQSGLNGFDCILGHGDPSWRVSVNGSGFPGASDGSAGDANSVTAINDGNWHQVAYTYNGFVGQANNGALYVDGVLTGNNTVQVPPVGDNLDVWIGGAPDYAGQRMFFGNIAHVAVFAQGLTTNQVTALYNGNFVATPNTLSITNVNHGTPILNWQVGVLLQAPTEFGPWKTNYSAVPPYTVPVSTTGSNQYYRLQLHP